MNAPVRVLLLLALLAQACSNSNTTGQPAPPVSEPDAEAGPEEAGAYDSADESSDAIDEAEAEAGPCEPSDASVPNPPMVFVPAGDFWMGCDQAGDPACTVGEMPAHLVTLSGYWIDRHEVTMGDYAACIRACVCAAPAVSFDPAAVPERPVVGVTFDQAQQYCHWLGAALPTEAQWEKAARSSDGRHFPWGAEEPDCSKAAFLGCALDGASGVTFPAGAFSPQGDSPYGAQDLAGNVWEWVADWYAPYDPAPSVDPTGPAGTGIRIWRGGSYLSKAPSLRVAHRLPEQTPYYHALGFRCVMTP